MIDSEPIFPGEQDRWDPLENKVVRPEGRLPADKEKALQDYVNYVQRIESSQLDPDQKQRTKETAKLTYNIGDISQDEINAYIQKIQTKPR